MNWSNYQLVEQMNYLGTNKIPFLFVIDFEIEKPIIIKLSEIDNSKIKYKFNSKTNFECKNIKTNGLYFEKKIISFDFYKKKFDNVLKNITRGNTYLLNLTQPTQVQTNLSLLDIFYLSDSRYKLFYNNEFTFFSPEIFVQIKNQIISSNPMKGTIDANIKNARNIILNDKKEMAEHNTIVDLIRNDLNMVSKRVKVEDFRYIEKIETNHKNLLQVSSKISGLLPTDYHKNIGNIILALLPAGSISGAPKRKTVEIILETENYKRNYYTGVSGIFDGNNLDSCVNIRYLEKSDNNLIYKSGGGITNFSSAKNEFEEMTDKVYLTKNNLV